MILASGLASPPPEGLTPAQLIDRITAREQLQRVLCATQQADLVGFEVGLALGISPTAGASRVLFARTVLNDHPALHALALAGQRSMPIPAAGPPTGEPGQ